MPVALVTGAGSGIGRAAALKLAAMGYDLVLAGRTARPLEEAAEVARRHGIETCVVPTDVGDAAAVAALVEAAMERMKRIDVVVNAAGFAPMLPTHEVTPAQWRQIIDINLSSGVYLTGAVWPHMQRQHMEAMAAHREAGGAAALDPRTATGGVIVHISSEASRDPFPGLGAYACAKIGLNMLAKVTAVEGQPVGIRVFSIAPSGVETPMFRQLLSPEQVPTEMILQPDDVAALIADAVNGSLRFSSGETIYLHKRVP